MDQQLTGKPGGNISPKSGVESFRTECLWAGPALLGESPVWDPRSQRLFWIGCLEKKIWSAEADGGDVCEWDIPDTLGSIGLCEDGRLIAGLAGGFAFIDLSSDEAAIEWIGNPEPGLNTRLNDGKVDRQGRFWCGSLSMDFTSPAAALYRLDTDLSWHRMDTGITVSNGIAFSADGRRLYFSDSRIDQSHQYELDPETGALGERLPFIDTGKYAGRIDGATVDAAGNYWGALFDGGAVGCFSPQGDLLRLVDVPVKCPTMCTFGGPDMGTLFVASATFTMSDEEIAAEEQAGGLFAIYGLGARGIPEPCFAGR